MDVLAPTSINNLRQIKDFLKEECLDLSGMYQSTYTRIKSSDTNQKSAQRVLLWICYAQRPLHEVELQHAIATQLEDEDFDPDGITPAELLRSSCMGLVTCDDDGMYSLFHLTAYEFFRSSPDMSSDASHLLISRTCLTYLSFSSTGRQGCCEDLATLEARKSEFRLLDYAAKHCADHIQPVEAALLEDVTSFLHDDTLRQAFMQAFYHRHRDDEELRRITFETLPSGSPPLQVACGRGLLLTAERMLRLGADPKAPDAQGWTPLITATSYGHLEVVDLLLSHAKGPGKPETSEVKTPCNDDLNNQKGDIVGLNQPDNEGWTPLFWAIIKNQYLAAEQLLTAGSKINVQDQAWWTPIDWAAFRADRAFVDLILRFTLCNQLKGSTYFDIPNIGPDDFSPLFLAVAAGDKPSIEAMLKFGFEAPTNTGDNLKVLFGVLSKMNPGSRHHHDARGSILIPSFVPTDDFSVKLLESAIRLDERSIVKMLVELGASLGALKLETKRRTPLHVAACCGHYQICEYLLLKGASPSILDADGLTAMDLAIITGHPQCTRFFLTLCPSPSTLMKRGISLTTFVFGLEDSGSGRLTSRAPIHWRKLWARYEAIQSKSALPMLETRTIPSNNSTFDAQTTSSLRTNQNAFEFGDMTDVLDALLGSSCDLDATNEFWDPRRGCNNRENTALHHACSIANQNLIFFLITGGADVNRQNEEGETPLHKACSRYKTSEETIRTLVQRGARPNVLDTHGRSPLENACECASIEVIRCLVVNGAVINAYDDTNHHPLHAACKRRKDLGINSAETIEIINYIMSLSSPDILLAECQKPARSS
jgi:ankyrin repeat protein